MRTLSTSMLHNAGLVLKRTTMDLAAARKVPGCEELVSMLEARLADQQAIWDRGSKAGASPLDEAAAAQEAARRELERAQCAQAFGSADRDEALRLAGDAEHARQTLAVRQREYRQATNESHNPLGALTAQRVDKDRDSAEAMAKEAAHICLANHNANDDPSLLGKIDVNTRRTVANMTHGERAWAPFFEAIELAAYPAEAKNRKAARPLAALQAAFETRRANREHYAASQRKAG